MKSDLVQLEPNLTNTDKVSINRTNSRALINIESELRSDARVNELETILV
jgi:hypothetical protein